MTDIRAWLMKRPHPAKVRAEFDDGEDRTVRIGESRSRWRDASEALARAVKCEALDSDGELLRVWQTDELDIARAESSAKRGEMALVDFARILADSCDRAVLRHAEMTRTAFEQQAILVNALSGRLHSLEKAWHTLLMSQQDAADTGDPNSALVSALLAGVAPAMLAKAGASTPSNGSGS
jgi:hypothetical protein